MKLLLIFCFSLLSSLGADYVSQEQKDSLVLVAQPDSKKASVALIDGKPYLIEFADVQLLEEVMASVAIRGKDSDEYKTIKRMYPEQTNNGSAVFVIQMKDGAALPDKFLKKNKK